jgi:uncharacterized membrane protein YbhN (UPF0104 family)
MRGPVAIAFASGTLKDWLDQLWDTLASVSIPLLILGLAFQTLQTGFVALAWRNILRAAYREEEVKYRPILAYYAGGNALNAFLPASAGTVAMLGLFRARIKGATVPGLVGATVVENIFFGVMGALVYLWLFLGAAGSFDVHFGWLADHWFAAVIIVVGGCLLVAITVRFLWNRFKRTWEKAKEGGAIVRQPRKFMVQVVGVEAISYVARMGVNATFMYAFDVPVSVENVFLIVAAASISSTVAIAPGAVGAQTALASVVLKGVAPSSVISAYAIGQAIITTAWNIVFGLTLLAREIGWKETKSLAHRKKKGEGEEGGEALADAPDGTPVVAAAGPDGVVEADADEPAP